MHSTKSPWLAPAILANMAPLKIILYGETDMGQHDSPISPYYRLLHVGTIRSSWIVKVLPLLDGKH